MTVALIVWGVICPLLTLAVLKSSGDTIFGDTDDQMRAVQVLDWLGGAGWYDLHQDRLNPPAGLDLHWSRLPDLPIAAATLLLAPVLGTSGGLIGAAIVVPLLLLLALLLVVGWMAQPALTRPDDAPVAMLALALCLPVLGQFTPGRIDHHNWQLLFAAVAFGGALRLMRRPEERAPAVAAGMALGLGIWVGAESVPWIAVLCLVLVLRWILTGDRVVAAGRRFAVTLAAVALAALPVAVAPDRLFAVACDGFSIAYVGLAGAVLAFWVGLTVAAERVGTRKARLGLTLGLGAAALGGWLFAFPECRGGPLAGIDPVLAREWLGRVSEARPLHVVLRWTPEQVPYLIGLPLIGMAVAAVRLRRSRGEAAWTWVAVLLYLVLALLLTLWQVRVAPFANLFAVVPLAVLAVAGWQRAERRWQGWRQSAARAAVLLVLMPVPLLGHAVEAGSAALAGGEAEEADQDKSCIVRPLDKLASRAGGGPAVFAAFIDLGPKLLLHTRHSVLAAPYHRNNQGNLDVFRLFSATDPEAARAIIERRRVDFVLFCPGMAEAKVYAGRDGATSFLDRLAAGETLDWLRPIAIPEAPETRLFAVQRPAG